MFDFYHYNRPGKGVQKRDPNQPRTSLFFELFFRKLWDLCKVNVFYVFLLIPAFIVTMLVVGVISNRLTDIMAPAFAQIMGLEAADMSNPQYVASLVKFDLGARAVLALWFVVFLGAGPATAGVTYVLRNYGREEHAWLYGDTWRNLKSNFKQSMLLWILDLVVVYLMVIAIDFYASTRIFGFVGLCAVLSIVVLYLMMHIYVYQMMITFELPFKNILKNSVIMSIMTLPKTLLMLLILAVVHIVIPILILFFMKTSIISLVVFIILELVFLLAASAFTTNFFIYNTMEKYINQSLEEMGKADEKDDSNQKGE